jgi:ubiquitin C-terminal hydrolase
MNAVLQQLYAISEFTGLVLHYEFSDPARVEFQSIFAHLLLSSQKVVNTTSFISRWTGWDKKPVNPREQQDVNEFLQLFLDQLPS